ncbi:hypothetical protein COS18_02620 [Candidatus Falkowbacteria bacterium CG02_land_8_20_14_3_00_36_14]|uniref:PD(D/E)XK endonuclease domain-containing protein n=1 Tax=Candidatus Falkowbacteria bacterium CG02_land_8_20_14_3_00_36_14 TaxID=1974560 RepID=A0A2M7DP57_9BACT|nr:MAG: hypothetical protein COS18_02620 [Candidatus Falkowbacteria bacterium CG02_land_8_20_14_3_00_36_14]
MGRAYKNFWSLNTDEAVVTGILRDCTPKNVEVLIPLNAQMKGIDLILMNIESKKIISIQVKGSRAFEPRKSETEKYGEGSPGWFFFPKEVIERSTADYFIFLVYVIEQNYQSGRRLIAPHTITIPINNLKKLIKENKSTHGDGRYSFKFWINPKEKKSFDFRDSNYYVSEYLDKKGFVKLNALINK